MSVIVITGASSGIGATLARQLGRRGDRVVLAARRETELQRLADEIENGAIAALWHGRPGLQTRGSAEGAFKRLRRGALHLR
jgi:NAD(P)-dependent dehydrogenase (short-subunit alcohol dehydrogenase family)